ncbi:hypothetical protein GCM10020218_052710 [Dactylosporangium vinaceum]|uniref:RICIN domain-containing protein n=1 Tax=Dactylosporangium vinaceum TaxID=53362 RepID=A0ABV5M212_9ACTN
MRTTRALTMAVVAAVCSTVASLGPAWADPPGTTAPGGFANGEVEIVNDHARKCLDVPGGSKTVSQPIQEWSCDGADNQLWRAPTFSDGVFALVNVGSNLCLDIGANVPQDGGRVVQTPCDYWWYGTNVPTKQVWRWQSAQGLGQWMVNVYSGLCLALSPNTSANGTAIVVGACSTTTAKYWHVQTG